jgi:hypothetical protein
MAVNTTTALPVAPHPSLKALKLFVHVTPLHASVATAPPLLPNQLVRCVVLPEPSHSTVDGEALVPITGFVVSVTVNVPVLEEDLPHASVATNVTVALPVLPHRSDNTGLDGIVVHVTSLQASPATAPPLVASHVLKAALLATSPAHSTTVLDT